MFPPARILPCLLLLLTLSHAHAQEKPVAVIADQGLRLNTSGGPAVLPIKLSADWTTPQPGITRAIVVFHGKGRDVQGYYDSVVEAARKAGGPYLSSTFVVAPQFLIEADVVAHKLPADVLRWRPGAWESGGPAIAPVNAGAYDVIDTIVQRLADPHIFPNLKTITLAGHSGGGQALQRYAIVGRAESVAGRSIRIRYVIANPGSYLYFADERPSNTSPPFTYAVPHTGCDRFNRWRYGTFDPPPYIDKRLTKSWKALESDYAARDITYLLGTADTDPQQEDLDRSCAGELEGSNRFLRGEAYFQWLRQRHPAGWNQRLWFVPGVDHNAHRMFTSSCGVAALLESSTCTNELDQASGGSGPATAREGAGR